MQQEWKWFLVEESIAGISWSQAALRNDLLANPCAEAVSPVTPLPYTRSLGWRNAFLISTYYNSDVRFSGPRLVKKAATKSQEPKRKKGHSITDEIYGAITQDSGREQSSPVLFASGQNERSERRSGRESICERIQSQRSLEKARMFSSAPLREEGSGWIGFKAFDAASTCANRPAYGGLMTEPKGWGLQYAQCQF